MAQWEDLSFLEGGDIAKGNYHDMLAASAEKYGIPEKLPILQRMLKIESGGNPNAVSPKGASGLMQLMPETAKSLGVKNINDPQENIDAGVRYFKEQLDTFGDDALALAAYNAGPNRVKKAGGIPNIKETQKYVQNILSPISGTMGGGFNDPRGDKLHNGGDISAAAGTPFNAPTRLYITHVRDQMSNSPGGMVWGMDPTSGLQFRFHHVVPGVKQGAMIEPGAPLGTLSNINGPHLDMKVFDPQTNQFVDWTSPLKRGDVFAQGQPMGGMFNPDTSGMVADASGQVTPAVVPQQDVKKQETISSILSNLANNMGPKEAAAAEPPKKPMWEDLPGWEELNIEMPKQPELSLGQKLFKTAHPYIKPSLEYGLMAAGGLIGSGLGIGGTVAGGTLGYAIGKNLSDLAEQYVGTQKPVDNLTDVGKKTASDIKEGLENTLMAESGAALASKAISATGKVVKPILGRLSGTGEKAIDEALKGNPQFVKAMRGEITPEEVVINAKDALQTIKNNRAEAYREQFKNIKDLPQELDITPIKDKLSDLMQKFRVKITSDGKLDFSTMAVNDKGRREIKKLIDTVSQWNDTSPEGVDALKRYIGDFYSDSSQARAFVQPLKKEIAAVLENNIPGYAEMTADYAKASKLITELGKGLSINKAELGGRATADQTLRRLMSTMRDNFKLRGEMVEALSNESGKDTVAQIAGTTMSGFSPYGISGSGAALVADVALASINPKLIPVILASSPRIQGEFLRYFGRMSLEHYSKMAGYAIPAMEEKLKPALQGNKPWTQSTTVYQP